MSSTRHARAHSRKHNVPANAQLWQKATDESSRKFRNVNSTYAMLYARQWYKDHGGTWTHADDKPIKEKQSPQNRVPLMEFEQYADVEDGETSEKDAASQQDDEKSKKHYWFKEQLVDLSRPVHDEAGNVIGFHPCGSNSKDYQHSLSSYRTSYPRCMPKSKAMRMNAMEREKYLRTHRQMPETETESAHEESSENYEE